MTVEEASWPPKALPDESTVEHFSRFTGLPVSFLDRQHIRVREDGARGLVYGYFDEHGEATNERSRGSFMTLRSLEFEHGWELDGVHLGLGWSVTKLGRLDEGQRWIAVERAEDLGLYGLWRSAEIAEREMCFLCVHEDDCLALWHSGFPALAIAGPENWHPRRDTKRLNGAKTIYVPVASPDDLLPQILATTDLADRVRLFDTGSSPLIRRFAEEPDTFHQWVVEATETSHPTRFWGSWFGRARDEELFQVGTALAKQGATLTVLRSILDRLNEMYSIPRLHREDVHTLALRIGEFWGPRWAPTHKIQAAKRLIWQQLDWAVHAPGQEDLPTGATEIAFLREAADEADISLPTIERARKSINEHLADVGISLLKEGQRGDRGTIEGWYLYVAIEGEEEPGDHVVLPRL